MEASHGGAEHGVGPKFGLVGRPVKFDHHFVDQTLFINWQTDKGLLKVVFHVVDRF